MTLKAASITGAPQCGEYGLIANLAGLGEQDDDWKRKLFVK